MRSVRAVSGDDEDREPTEGELAAIEAEWPLIEAELELLDAEIVALVTREKSTALAWRRLRRAQRRVLAAVSDAAGARARGVSRGEVA